MKRHKQTGRAAPPRKDLELSAVLGIVERAKPALSEADYATLRGAVDTLAFLTQELAARGTSIERLRKLLFGGSTEKTRNVVGDAAPAEGGSAPGDGNVGKGEEASKGKPKPPGHGRNGAADYPGATKVNVPHESLHGGDGCPDCHKGKVYALAEPAMLLRIKGMAPLAATAYACDRLRCNLCGEVFTAKSPEGVGDQKYDETAGAMIGLLKYGAGLPFHRIEKLEGSLGVPLPASTQWEIVEAAAAQIEPAHVELVRQAAQGEVLHNDDTTVRILELARSASSQTEDEPAPTATGESGTGAKPTQKADPADERTGVFTTGIVARAGDHRMALFFSGRRHAGENLNDVLARRASDLPPPIQMCDALSRNLPADFKTILSHCLVHSRRYFIDVVDAFPTECRHLLEELSKVYKYDAETRKRALSPEERLRLHQAESKPVMDGIAEWLRMQIVERKVEPNSGLGEAIGYMRKHWKELTLFLRVAGAPLDNNVCERALKKAILHRKNSLFFKTKHGAHVGDVFMSLIHTAELNRVNPFDYLVALQKHHKAVASEPSAWLPWNYTEAIARAAQTEVPPS